MSDHAATTSKPVYRGPTMTTADMVSMLQAYASGMVKTIDRNTALAVAERLEATDRNWRMLAKLGGFGERP